MGDILAEDKQIDWSLAGVQGGIPNRTTIYQTISAGSSLATVQTAVDNCTDGQVVQLASGTFNFAGGLVIDRDNIVLRGATGANGEPVTIINFSDGGWGCIDVAKAGYPSNNWAGVSSRGITSGLARNSTQITVASSPTNLGTGQLMVIDQLADDSLVFGDGTEGGGTWGRNDNRMYQQFVRVKTITGSTITFEPPLYGSYWNTGLSPEIYWFGSSFSQIATGVGIEHIKINRTNGAGGTHNLHFGPAMNCWAKNVWSHQCDDAHIRTAFCNFMTFEECVFDTHDNIGSATYAFYITFTSASLIQHNIVHTSPCAVGLLAAQGCVVAYNYARNFVYSQSDWLPECMMTHGGHCYMNLFEGNHVPSMWSDFIHSNHSYNVFTRNRLPGWETGKTSSTRPVNVEQQNDYISFIGNILGYSGYHTALSGAGNTSIYNLDLNALSGASGFLRKGNWTVISGMIPADEALGDTVISDSYYLTSKPNIFGDLSWPPYEVDSNPQTATYTKIPAGYRYENNAWPNSDFSSNNSRNKIFNIVKYFNISRLTFSVN